MVKHVDLNCTKCDFKTHLMHGPSLQSESFSDVNEDFGCMEVFECKKCKTVSSVSLSGNYCLPKGSKATAKCPTCGGKMKHHSDIPKKCPKCGGKLHHEVIA